MENDAPVIYGLEFQARALAAHTAETESIRFFVGTQSLRFDNQVHQIDFDDENNTITKTMFLHRDGEVWGITASAIDRDILATVYNKIADGKAEMCAAVWRLPANIESNLGEDNVANAASLELLTRVDTASHGEARGFMWHPSGEASQFVVLADSHILLCDLDVSSHVAKLVSTAALESKSQHKFTSGQWNPHHNCSQIATASDTCIRGWDLRSMQQMYSIENAHGQLVRDLDFNPNKQYYLASCGDDCKVKFWDVRSPGEPVKVLTDHSHWVWSVRYNHFHDQLVLTSSSDSRVVLNNAASISSEPYGHLAEDDEIAEDDVPREKGQGQIADGVVATYEEHEDSVYAVEWSSADPWLFASLSYDGRLVINRVPRATKYRILL